MLKKSERVIYFIQGSIPSAEEAALAAQLGNNVVFRNAQFATESCPEDCDAVAGTVIPAAYAGKKQIGGTILAPAPVVPPAPPSVDGWGNPAAVLPPAPPVEA